MQSAPSSAGRVAICPQFAIPMCSAMAGACGEDPGATPLTIATGSSPASGRTTTAQAARCSGLINGLLLDPSEASRNGAEL
eukprot:1557895-Pyramimonas_sp.AAC.1